MSIHDRILLATDLSARSDRALDRAIMLAARDDAELVVLHVMEPVAGNRFYPSKHEVPALVELVREQLRHDLGERADRTTIRIEEGDPGEVIERVARELAATLVIVGVARVERLGRFVLGETVERVVRAVEAPLLIVTERPRTPYARIAVAVDLSPVSAQTIELITTAYPQQRITALHAYQPLSSHGTTDLSLAAVQWRRVAETNLQQWVAASDLAEPIRAQLELRVGHGDPPTVLREASAHGALDLVVIGTRGRGRIFEFFVGSIAKQILAELPCDALFVRDRRSLD